MRGGTTWVFGGLLWLAAGACFDDAAPSDDGCADGSAGCDCYGNGSCDTGLECTPEDKCVDPGCLPGELNCTCNDGACLTDLECTTDNVCRPAGGTEGGTGSGTGGLCEPEMGDDACAMCSKAACCDEAMQCIADPVCNCLNDCLARGAEDCEGECGPPSDAFMQVAECAGMHCPECGGACNPPGEAPPCTKCAAQMCCRELDRCAMVSECACLESCLAGGAPPTTCRQDCGVPDAAGIPELDDLQTCAMNNGCTKEGDNPSCYGG